MNTRKNPKATPKAKAAKQGKKACRNKVVGLGANQTCLKIDGQLLLLESLDAVGVEFSKAIKENPKAKVEIVHFASKEEAMKAMMSEITQEENSPEAKLEANVSEDSDGKICAVVTPRKEEAETVAVQEPVIPTGSCMQEFGNDLPMLHHAPMTAMKEPEMHVGNDLPVSQSVDNVARSCPEEEGAESPFLKRMKETVKNAGMQVVIYLVKSQPSHAPVRLAVIDIINPGKKFTHWLHRPPKWVEVFKMFTNVPGGERQINTFLSYLSAVRLRDPHKDDQAASIVTKGRNGQLTLYQDVFLACIPRSVMNDQVPKYLLGAFSPVLNDKVIQEMYKVAYIGQNEVSAQVKQMLKPVKDTDGSVLDGKYWHMLRAALAENYLIVEPQCLNKVLTSEGIAVALQMLFPKENITQHDIQMGRIPEGLKRFVLGSD